VQVESGQGVGEYLKRLQQRQAEARQYEHSPLVKVQEWSEVERGARLFEYVLVFENYPMDPMGGRQAGGKLRITEVENVDVAHYPLLLGINTGEELRSFYQYDRRRLGGAEVERLIGHLWRVLEQMAAAPEKKLSELSLLSEAERRQMLVEWNQTAREYGGEECIHRLIEEQVERMPGEVAVVFGEQELSYGELNRRANQLAHYLRRQGVGAEVRVGVCMERSLEMVIGLLGVLKAGGAYVPLDPGYPAERLSYMLGDAQAAVLLTERGVRGVASGVGVRVIEWEEQREEIEKEAGTNPELVNEAENLAYVIYTSGSTGQPKGAIGWPGCRSVTIWVLGTGYCKRQRSRLMFRYGSFSGR